ncbi:hypothetical protein E4Q08_17125 [Candidatus Accumulibacter phosphatis]|uniref:Restriction endonuclease n=1 Tax=Candidatus Accumulibacter contiguus TaxID=2954381 RepID=A0ABX1TB01_9PROT|nr:hypothetical protein [Candidatus Accumulibacter contiguus]NMQ06847.1 hypothetical protein [Candidatus Accumulibacter contiguus]
MPRRTRPATTQRSEHWLRVAVNQYEVVLNQRVQTALGIDATDTIEWLSPVRSDDFAEYFDQEFVDRLGLGELDVPLNDFWPKSGPRWDGLARTKSGKLILVEAKAYIEEAVDYKSKAGADSKARISKALATAKAAFRATADANWEEPLYQYANRLAHLYYLRELNKRDAYLLFVYFANAPDVPNPCTSAHWEGAIRLAEKCLGLGAHPFRPYIGSVVWSVGEMLSNPLPQPTR